VSDWPQSFSIVKIGAAEVAGSIIKTANGITSFFMVLYLFSYWGLTGEFLLRKGPVRRKNSSTFFGHHSFSSLLPVEKAASQSQFPQNDNRERK